jgi:hypothetical protein
MVLRTMFVAAAEPSARSCSVNVIGKNDVGLCEANRTRLEVATTSLVYTDRWTAVVVRLTYRWNVFWCRLTKQLMNICRLLKARVHRGAHSGREICFPYLEEMFKAQTADHLSQDRNLPRQVLDVDLPGGAWYCWGCLQNLRFCPDPVLSCNPVMQQSSQHTGYMQRGPFATIVSSH